MFKFDIQSSYTPKKREKTCLAVHGGLSPFFPVSTQEKIKF